MADETIGEVIATNLVPDPRLTKILPGGVNVVQSVMSGGMGVSLERGVGDGEAYATPWVDAGSAAGDKVCVLIVSSNTLQPPAGGVLFSAQKAPPHGALSAPARQARGRLVPAQQMQGGQAAHKK